MTELRGVLPYISLNRYVPAMKGRVFEQFSLGSGIEIRELWSRIGYHLP